MPGERIPEKETILGTERLCRGCVDRGEPDPWWPVDEEFFFIVDGKPLGRCRACWSERTRTPDGRRVFVPLSGVA